MVPLMKDSSTPIVSLMRFILDLFLKICGSFIIAITPLAFVLPIFMQGLPNKIIKTWFLEGALFEANLMQIHVLLLIKLKSSVRNTSHTKSS